jgi:hypothetical protein
LFPRSCERWICAAAQLWNRPRKPLSSECHACLSAGHT